MVVGLGSSPAIRGSDAPGERILGISALALGVASFSTARVLHLTEPKAHPLNVTRARGMLDVGGTL